MLEAQVRPLVMTIPRFIQLRVLLLPLKPMGQSRCGVIQVALSILKPAGSVGATVQLAIAPPELLKVMFVMVEPIKAIWSAPAVFARLGAGLSINSTTCTISGTPTAQASW
jgi:hypothetical protein